MGKSGVGAGRGGERGANSKNDNTSVSTRAGINTELHKTSSTNVESSDEATASSTMVHITADDLRLLINQEINKVVSSLCLDLTKRFEDVDAQLKEIGKKIDINSVTAICTTLLTKLESNIGICESFIKRANEVPVVVPKNDNRKVDHSANPAVLDAVTEIKLREEKKHNLIFFNLPNSTKNSPEEKMADDITVLQNLMNELGVETSDFGKVFRIGRVVSERPQPIIVKFKSLDDKISVLKNSYKLQKSKINVIIKNDLTRQQQETEKALYEELKLKRSNAGPGEKYFIRNGLVMLSKDSK